MSKQVRFRRGTTAQHTTFTGAQAEVTVDTTKTAAVVHDGSTAGGIPLLREDRPRGYVRQEIFTTSGTSWTSSGKTDLKRIRVTCYGGGAGGISGNARGGGGGGMSQCTLELTDLTSTVTVTVGAGGAAGTSGGTSSFGSYVSATGGTSGGNGGTSGGSGGGVSGNPVYNFGGQGVASAETATVGPDSPVQYGRANGGGFGAGKVGTAANGIRGGGGGGGGAGTGYAGAQGCVIVEEIYGMY
jgi:hypothetical protein